MPRPIYFDHIPKTGGTSFHQVLIAWFGNDQVSPPIAGRRFADVMDQYGHFQAISGHIHYGIDDRLSEARVNVTIMRDPIDRAVSQYFFNKETIANLDRRDQLTFNQSLESFLSQDEGTGFAEYSNVYARHFAALSPEYHSAGDALDDNHLLKLAKISLSLFDVVGVLSHFEDFCAMTAIASGISRHVSPAKVRVTRVRPSLDQLSDEALTRLRKLNSVDIELTAFARDLFRRARTRTLIHSVAGAPNVAGSTAAHADSATPTKETMPSRETGSKEIEILSITAHGSLSTGAQLLTGEELCITITLLAHVTEDDLTVGIHISEPSGSRVYGTNSQLLGMTIGIKTPGQLMVVYKMKCELGRGEYLVGATLHKGPNHLDKCYHWTNYSTSFTVLGALGAYFEGKARLQSSVHVMKGEHSPASYEISEDGCAFPKSVMLQSPPLTDFRAAFSVRNFDYQPKAGEIFNLECFVTNCGEQAWPVAGTRPVSVCYHWLKVDRTVAVFDGIRTRLVSRISSGEELHVLAQIQAPYTAGDYVLQLTAVQDGVGWFDEKGCQPSEISIRVIT
jgi:hypothetical protein